MGEIVLQFSTSTAWQSAVIRRLCHSEFSHVDIIVGDRLLGVSGADKSIGDPGGVCLRKPGLWPYLRPPKTARLKTVDDDMTAAIVLNGTSQLMKPFDNGALWDFLSDSPVNRDWRDENSWFCSELVAWCLEKAGFFPYPLISAKNRITPADLLLLINPMMSEDNIREFAP